MFSKAITSTRLEISRKSRKLRLHDESSSWRIFIDKTRVIDKNFSSKELEFRSSECVEFVEYFHCVLFLSSLTFPIIEKRRVSIGEFAKFARFSANFSLSLSLSLSIRCFEGSNFARNSQDSSPIFPPPSRPKANELSTFRVCFAAFIPIALVFIRLRRKSRSKRKRSPARKFDSQIAEFPEHRSTVVYADFMPVVLPWPRN
mgnify:CR=1 FL=1